MDDLDQMDGMDVCASTRRTFTLHGTGVHQVHLVQIVHLVHASPFFSYRIPLLLKYPPSIISRPAKSSTGTTRKISVTRAPRPRFEDVMTGNR